MILTDGERCVVESQNDIETTYDLFRAINPSCSKKLFPAMHTDGYDGGVNVSCIICTLMPLKILIDTMLKAQYNYIGYEDEYTEPAERIFVRACRKAGIDESLSEDIRYNLFIRSNERLDELEKRNQDQEQ